MPSTEPKYQSVLADRGKEEAVQQMFTSIARFYDFNNTVLSLGLHYYWKRIAVDLAALKPGDRVIDVGAGTFDLSIRALPRVQATGRVVAMDLNEKMLKIGQAKAERRGIKDSIRTVVGNAEFIPFPDNHFDAALSGFCLRNVDDLARTAAEILRVLKPGGRFVCLEFSRPTRRVFRRLYDFYSFVLLPGIGTLVSRDRTGVYRYLPDSIRKFPAQDTFRDLLLRAGFKTVRYQNLSGGIVAIHVGVK